MEWLLYYTCGSKFLNGKKLANTAVTYYVLHRTTQQHAADRPLDNSILESLRGFYNVKKKSGYLVKDVTKMPDEFIH